MLGRQRERFVRGHEELLALLFGADGAKLSALKLTMCRNDFSTQFDKWSTYDDTAGDVSMDDFSIARDMYEGEFVQNAEDVNAYLSRSGEEFGAQLAKRSKYTRKIDKNCAEENRWLPCCAE